MKSHHIQLATVAAMAAAMAVTPLAFSMLKAVVQGTAVVTKAPADPVWYRPPGFPATRRPPEVFSDGMRHYEKLRQCRDDEYCQNLNSIMPRSKDYDRLKARPLDPTGNRIAPRPRWDWKQT